MCRIIIVAVAGAIAVIVLAIVSYSKNKKTFNACKSEPGRPGAFEYKGNWYDRAKYVELRSEVFKQNKVKELPRHSTVWEKSGRRKSAGNNKNRNRSYRIGPRQKA